MLDNARTLQIHFSPNGEMGEKIYRLVNPKSDTLGNVQRLCRLVYCMNEKDKNDLLNRIESGDIRSVNQGIKAAEKMRQDKNLSR